jgi:ketosteroid isomerase-like protein
MLTVDEIAILEERLRVAELGPDPAVFEELLADDVILVAENGQPFFAKQKVVDAHRSGAAPKFTRVEMRDLQIVDHGSAAVVTCTGTYEGPHGGATLRFMRIWVRKDGKWRVVAGAVSPG